MHAQQPHGLSDVGDLIQSTEVYECFDSNTIEVDIMLDYLTEHGLRPREIYCDVRYGFAMTQSSPGLTVLIPDC